MKGEGGEKLWQHYAEELLRRRWSEKASSRQYLLIPAPSRQGNKDHAYYFVQALTQAGVGFELYNCLSRVEALGSQKKRTRSQRERTAMEWAENFTQGDFNAKSAGKHIIFVDDVVTTGSTARAAWRTLGKPRDFAVWALAQRGLSCGASKDLI
jgi:predicted amidophosphoribosyltransferase